MRFFIISLLLIFLFSTILCANHQAFAHRDFPSDGKSYHTIVTLKQVSFHSGASGYDVVGNSDYVFGWHVELAGHPLATNVGTFADEDSTGAILKHESVVIDHIECGPKGNLQFYVWGAESDQKNTLGTDRLMKDIIKNSNPSQVTAKQIFESAGDDFIGFQSDLVNADDDAADELFEERIFLDSDKTIAVQFVIDRVIVLDDTKCKTSTISETPNKVKQGNDYPTKSKTEDKNSRSKINTDSKNQPAKNGQANSAGTQIKISNDDLKTLYKIAKLHESAATSLSSANDQQKIILQKATTSANKVLTKDQKDKLKPLLKEQDSDKKDIKAIQDYAKKVSNTIKKLAQKEGLKPSDLDKIAKPVKDGKPSKKGPVDQLKQDATNAKNNLDDAKKFQEELDLQKIAHQIGDILPDSEGRGDFEKRMEKRFEEQQARERDRQDREREQKLAKQQEEADEKSKQHVIDMMQQLLELVQKQEQAQTDSILDTISEPTLKDLFVQTSPTQDTKPVAKKDPSKPITATNFISVQSKRGTYSEPTNPCSTKNVTIEATWVLAKSSNIDSGSVTVLQLDLNKPNGPTSKQREIKDGVIQYSDYAQHPGRYQVWLAINGKVVQDGLIDITIPNLCTTTSPPSVIAEPGGGGFAASDTKPILTIPKQITQEATGPSGASVDYVPIGFDKEDGSITPVCNPPPYSIFPIGTTTVSCTVTDSIGNSVSGSFIVTIRDTTPPNIPAFQPREGVKDESGIQVFYEVTATDIVDGAVQVSCNYPSGYKFPIGVTVLTCTAMDSHGNQASRSLQITVTSTQSGQ